MDIILHHSFSKQLKKLPHKIQGQFFKRAKLLSVDQFNPLLNNHSVSKVFPNRRSINVTGDYRALFVVSDDVCMFTDIGTHAQLYR